MSSARQPAGPAAAWKRWLAGRTLRARLIIGLLALFTVASLGVGVVTTVALGDFLLSRLDQQVNTAGQALSHSIENSQAHGQVPGQGPGPDVEPANPSCRNASQYASIAAGQAPRTFAARLDDGGLSYACVVTDTVHGPGLKAVRMSAADVAILKRMPVAGLPNGRHPGRSYPVTRYLSGLGDYRLTAFTGGDGDVHIAGLPISGVRETVRQLELVEVIVFGSALIVMGLAGTGLIRLSLRPLGRVTATAAEVSALPLESGEVVLPHRVAEADPRTEVGRLGRSFNQMLGHVEASLATRQASEDKLRRFVADASHELRTPLAGIRGYTELALRTGGDLSPEIRTALGRVDAESVRMSRMVDDLLLLARLDAGRPLAHEPVDLTRLAIEVTSDAQVAGPGYHWVLDLPSEAVVITGDQHRLHQVLANLLSNARTHTPQETTITVRVARAQAGRDGDGDGGDDGGGGGNGNGDGDGDGNSGGNSDGVELTVTDDGPGIPAELQAHIWDRFARADTARSRTAGSTGLGLAIVRAVVIAHRGRLSVDSQPGKTTFRIWLPADRP